jgi:hypothetical protein
MTRGAEAAFFIEKGTFLAENVKKWCKVVGSG